MVGTPGRSGGTNRKRSDLKLGRPTVGKDNPAHPDNVSKPEAETAEQPELVFPPNGDGTPWVPHAQTVRLWESMAHSGYHEFYTRSDWEAAAVSMMNIDRIISELIYGSIPANKSAELRATFADLMVTESSRRRLKIEVQRAGDSRPPLAAVASIDRAKAAGL